MSNNLFRFLIIPILLLNIPLLDGQTIQGRTIEGLVVDIDNDESIPFVNIGFSGTSFGTSSDDQGIFQLTLPIDSEDKYLLFSSINYKSKSILIKELLSMDKIIIKLIKDTINLPTMVFREKEDMEVILNNTFNKTDKQGYIINQYYKGKVISSSGVKFYDMNAIFRYMNIAQENGSFSISNCAIHKKNNLSENKDDPVNNSYYNYFMFYFNVSDYSYHCNLGSGKCRSNVDLEFSNFVIYDGKMCYKIEYKFISTKDLSFARNKIRSLEGTLFIDPENYDIVRWETVCLFEEISDKKIEKFGEKGYPLRFTWTRNYREIEGKYYLSILSVFQENSAISDDGMKEIITHRHNCFSMNVHFGDSDDLKMGQSNCEHYNINMVKYNKSYWESIGIDVTRK